MSCAHPHRPACARRHLQNHGRPSAQSQLQVQVQVQVPVQAQAQAQAPWNCTAARFASSLLLQNAKAGLPIRSEDQAQAAQTGLLAVAVPATAS